MVYIHYAEMDTWLVQITDGNPCISADKTLAKPISLLRELRNGRPAHCYVLSNIKDAFNLIRGSVNKPPYDVTTFAFTFGEQF